MLGHTFYHSTIRKYVALFGTLFNQIYINRPDSAHNQVKTVKVPINYGSKEKVLARVKGDPDLNRKPAIVLPRISFEITSMQYAASRKLITLGKRYTKVSSNPEQLAYQYNPVPYDIEFALSVIVKNVDDGTRIIEQILPFFTPEWTPTVELIPEMGIKLDIPIVLNSVKLNDSYEGSFEEARIVTWDLSFTLKGYIFGPVRKSSMIRFTDVNFYDASANVTPLETLNVQPALLANGSPTSDLNQSIDNSLIFPDDNYGYSVIISPAQ